VRAAKACGQPGCPHLVPCPDHPKVAWAGSTRRARLPSDWERRRRSVLARDEVCQDHRVCRGLALAVEVDHIQRGDDHSLSNLQGICVDCHRAKTQAEAEASRRT
jgi:5-methylcytosine-specific restriction protein A